MTRLLTEQDLQGQSRLELDLKHLIKPQNHYFLTSQKSRQRSLSNTKTGLDHGVGHFVKTPSQKGLQQGSSLAIFSHGIHI